MLLALLLAVCPPQQFCNTTGAPTGAHLFAAASSGKSDAWAVGEAGSVVHFDGQSWSPSAAPTNDRLNSVVSLGPSDVWTSGGRSVFRYDGSWHELPNTAGKGWVGPVVRHGSELWVLSIPPQRIVDEALAPVPDAAKTLTGDIVIAACSTGSELFVVRRTAQETLVFARYDGKRTQVDDRGTRGSVASVACVKDAAWVSSRGEVLRCIKGICAQVPAPADLTLLDGPAGPYGAANGELLKWNGKAFAKVASAPGRWFGGSARADDEVVLAGESGRVGRYDGKSFETPARVDVGRVDAVAATPSGEIWVGSDLGVFRGGAAGWTIVDGLPKDSWGVHSLAVLSPSDVWANCEQSVCHFDGKRWSKVTDGKQSLKTVWARAPGEVYAAGDGVYRISTGGKLEQVIAPKPGWYFTRLAAGSDAVWVLARGPRPEYSDGPPTKDPDQIVELRAGKPPAWFAAPGRPSDIASVKGELWATMESGGTQRRVNGEWQKVSDRGGRGLVPTPNGVLITTPMLYAWEWDGAQVKQLKMPAMDLVHGVSTKEGVWLGGSHTVMHRAP